MVGCLQVFGKSFFKFFDKIPDVIIYQFCSFLTLKDGLPLGASSSFLQKKYTVYFARQLNVNTVKLTGLYRSGSSAVATDMGSTSSRFRAQNK